MSVVLALACTVTLVDPALGTAVGDPAQAQITIRHGRGAISGMPQLAAEKNMRIRVADNGEVALRSRQFRGQRGAADFSPLWAKIDRTGDGYALRWMMAGAREADGGFTAAAWARGKCTERAASANQGKSS